MAEEAEAMHTIDDDVTFERMKSMPKKTNFYSTHRQLSWQRDREIKQFERDRNLTTFGLTREQTSMAERLVKLQEAQKQIQSRRHSEPSGRKGRRSSEPCIAIADLKKLESTGIGFTNLKDEPKTTETPVSTRRLHTRRNTVAEGMGDKATVPFLRRITAPSLGSTQGHKRNSSLGERQTVIREEAA